MICNFCGSEDIEFMFQTDLEDELTKSIMEFYECKNCGRYVELRVYVIDRDPDVAERPALGESDS